MAIFRKIHTTFWSDSFISDLDRDKKLFYLYLLTNERTSQCGIYEITKKQISFDLGYTIDTISKLFEYFIKIGKIRYNEATKELAIKNWLKYNGSNSPKVQSCINKELEKVKDTLLIEYINSIDTQSQQEQEQEQEQEQDSKTCFSFDEFWNLYNKKLDTKTCKNKYSKLSEAERQKIKDSLPIYLSTLKDKQYQKYPQTYLNNQCWNDELFQPKKSNLVNDDLEYLRETELLINKNYQIDKFQAEFKILKAKYNK
jgi:hypothetical protein